MPHTVVPTIPCQDHAFFKFFSLSYQLFLTFLPVKVNSWKQFCLKKHKKLKLEINKRANQQCYMPPYFYAVYCMAIIMAEQLVQHFYWPENAIDRAEPAYNEYA